MNKLVTKGAMYEVANVDDLVNSFLSGRKASTISAYRQDLQEFSRFLEVKNLQEAAKLLISLRQGQANAIALKYKIYLIEAAKLQSATVNRRLAALRSLVKLARTLGLVSWELEIDNQPFQAYRDVTGIGSEGMDAIFKTLKGRTDPKSIRDRAMLRLLFDLGLRREEVCTLEVSDLDLDRASIAILGKGNLQKELLSLPHQSIEALLDWIAIRGISEGPLFYRLDKGATENKKRLTGTGLYSIVKDLGKRAGISQMTVHKIRHSAITSCAQAIAEHNLGIEIILKFSRHKSLNTALIYFDHLENKQGQLAALVAKKAG